MRGTEHLHPVVRQKAVMLQALAQERFKLKIIFLDTLRTEAEQAAYYAQGRMGVVSVNQKRKAAGMPAIRASENKVVTKAKSASASWHGYGLAFDIAITDAQGKQIIWNKNSDWNKDGKDDWAQVGSLADEVGLEWGGHFTSIYDAPHYQDRMGLTIQQAQAKYPAGKVIPH